MLFIHLLLFLLIVLLLLTHLLVEFLVQLNESFVEVSAHSFEFKALHTFFLVAQSFDQEMIHLKLILDVVKQFFDLDARIFQIPGQLFALVFNFLAHAFLQNVGIFWVNFHFLIVEQLVLIIFGADDLETVSQLLDLSQHLVLNLLSHIHPGILLCEEFGLLNGVNLVIDNILTILLGVLQMQLTGKHNLALLHLLVADRVHYVGIIELIHHQGSILGGTH